MPPSYRHARPAPTNRHQGSFDTCPDPSCAQARAFAAGYRPLQARPDNPLPRLRHTDPLPRLVEAAHTLDDAAVLAAATRRAQRRVRTLAVCGLGVALACGLVYYLDRHAQVDVAARLITRGMVREAGLGFGRGRQR